MEDTYFEIRHEGDHYVGYIDGAFFCSGDRFNEVTEDIEEAYKHNFKGES